MMKRDIIDREKIESYVNKYGYPNAEKYGSKAAIAPILVIHHMTDLSVRKKYFKLLYQAYKTGDVEDNFFSLYLWRTYLFQFKKEHKMENPYTTEDKVNLLIHELGLDTEKQEVLAEMN